MTATRFIPPGRISMDTLASKAGLTRRQVENYTHQGLLFHERAAGHTDGIIHYDPIETGVALALSIMLSLRSDAETIQNVTESIRTGDPQEYVRIPPRIWLDVEGL